jgi:hypothetical protein
MPLTVRQHRRTQHGLARLDIESGSYQRTLLYLEDNKANLELMEGLFCYRTEPTPRWQTIK